MRILLKVWRQTGPRDAGRFADYTVDDVSPDMSFLEMLDVVNEGLIAKGEDPIAFDSDCREGICGACGFVINGVAHGPDPGTTVCQLHMRRFNHGDRVVLEPWRARAFPIVKDLVVDRSAFDRIIQAGGYTSVNVGAAPDGNAILIPEGQLPSRRWIPRPASAAAPASPRARTRRQRSSRRRRSATSPSCHRVRWNATARVVAMVDRHDTEGFGSCSNEGECEAVCPKEISITNIARMNREYFRAMLLSRE